MKNIISNIKWNWRKTPNSVKFWNGLVLLGLIISGVFSLDLLWGELTLMSILTLALLIGSDDDGKELDKHIWIWFAPLTWIIICLGVLVFLCIKLYESTIIEFNDWLDKEK